MSYVEKKIKNVTLAQAHIHKPLVSFPTKYIEWKKGFQPSSRDQFLKSEVRRIQKNPEKN